MVDLLKAYKFEYEKTKKYYGQHFLTNKDIVELIVRNCELNSNDFIIEIGSGCGILTQPLLESGAKVCAVEIDKELCYFLKKYLFYYPNLEILNKDFLTLNMFTRPMKLVGNLPYNVAARILLHCLDFRENIITMVFMFQKEVADRIMSNPNNKSYSFISVLTKLYFNVEKVKTISGENFWPKANVDSTILKFIPRNIQYMDKSKEKEFFAFLKECFSAKRKTLKNNLKKHKNISSLLEKMFLNKNIRAEQLEIDDFVKLFFNIYVN